MLVSARGFFVMCGLWLSVALPAWAWSGVVTHVSDGDTLWIKPFQGAMALKIRLQGIDAPEICQSFGWQSQMALQAAVLGQVVEVEVEANSRDNYGRVLANLTRQGQDVGAWMVGNGYAWSYSFRHQATPYDELQAQAIRQRLGLFADPQALQPRIFRKRFGLCPSPVHPAAR